MQHDVFKKPQGSIVLDGQTKITKSATELSFEVTVSLCCFFNLFLFILVLFVHFINRGFFLPSALLLSVFSSLYMINCKKMYHLLYCF